VDSNNALSDKDFLDSVWGAVNKLYGEIGASQTCMVLVDYSEHEKTAVIRVALNALPTARASIASITRIAGKEASVHVIAVSGTIKSLHKKN
jgi:ribonuclease P/MRP protein subunit POP5